MSDSLPLIITAENGRSTVYHARELRHDIQFLAREFRKTHKGAKVVASHIAIGPNTSRLVVQMRCADGWSENVSCAI